MFLKNLLRRKRLERLIPHRRKPMIYGNYCLLYDFGAIANHSEVVEKAKKPETICGRWMPETLDHITMGTLVDVLHAEDVMKMLVALYNVTTSELQTERADIVIGAIRWTHEQLSSIKEMFSRLNREYTAEELMAGAEELKGDIFTTIDWYARRMGISKHDEVLQVPWITIWRCANDDAQQRAFNERLQNIHRRK